MRLVLVFTLFIQSAIASDLFSLKLKRENPYEKSLFWGPFVSFLLPGADQFHEGQYKSAFLYSGVGVLGFGIASTANSDIEDDQSSFIDTENDELRREQYGLQLYMTAGGLSAYHSYRSAIKYRKDFGQFNFLPEEQVDDLLKAPFEVSFLKRKTTYLPLLLVTGIVLLDSGYDGIATQNFSSSDAFFTAGYSFNAGVNEEAIFRGIMMPNLYQSYGSLFWSNATTALIFGAAHGTKVIPWPQILMGYYLGSITQQNHWSLREAIFVHTWWDVIAIGAQYMEGKGENAMLYIPLYAASF